MTVSQTLLHQVLDTSGEEINYKVGIPGSQWIIFTHGATMDRGLSLLPKEYFANRYRIIAWDCTGLGRSMSP